MKSIAFKFTPVALTNIDPDDRLTDYSLDPAPDALKESIEAIGVIHPVILCKSADRYNIICGHRRVTTAQTLGLKEIPARVTDRELDAQTRLAFNLTENRAHRTYSDIEKGLIIHKLAESCSGPRSACNIRCSRNAGPRIAWPAWSGGISSIMATASATS